MKRIICLVLSFAFTFSLAACKSDNAQSSVPSTVTVSEVNGDEIENVTSNMNLTDFDEDFLNFIATEKEGNYMVSPLSFRYALGLLLAGAEGKTKTEMLTALGVKNVDEWTAYCTKFNGFVKRFYGQLDSEISDYNEWTKGEDESKSGGAPKRALRVANSIWKRADIEKDFTAAYKEYISKNYAAEYNTFTESNAVKKINAWVNQKTEKLIPRLLPDNYDTDNLAVVLMNALYFKNNWVNPFEKFATKEDDFNTKSGKKVKKEFMEQTENFAYYSDKNTQAVILPMYSGINMAFVLGDTADVDKKITKAQSAKVHLKIPKIDTETSFDNGEFVNFLAARGVSAAFSPQNADFSAMIDHKIRVDDIVQKTKIKTDEEGVEAAAVTAIMTKDTAMIPTEDKPIEFIADKPFSFYIYTTCDGVTSLLFAGVISE
ncbi:MAG: hypothetical protein J6T73_00955 [Clostridia bacterium]|nr:hypothetical protein [Clostridia bacterium]